MVPRPRHLSSIVQMLVPAVDAELSLNKLLQEEVLPLLIIIIIITILLLLASNKGKIAELDRGFALSLLFGSGTSLSSSIQLDIHAIEGQHGLVINVLHLLVLILVVVGDLGLSFTIALILGLLVGVTCSDSSTRGLDLLLQLLDGSLDGRQVCGVLRLVTLRESGTEISTYQEDLRSS